jgi:hypothetical protein
VLIHRVSTEGIGVLCQLGSEGPFRAELIRWMPGYATDGTAPGQPSPDSTSLNGTDLDGTSLDGTALDPGPEDRDARPGDLAPR